MPISADMTQHGTPGVMRMLDTVEVPPPSDSMLLAWLLGSLIVLPEEWDDLPAREREDISTLDSRDLILDRLAQQRLLTPFQVKAVRQGHGNDLILNHYRLLDILGEGGMGTVYRAEHIHLRRQAALKVMNRTVGGNPRLLHRFYAEARAVAKLQHPNIVACFDAGRVTRTDASGDRDYFVMELIPGQDLSAAVREKGPLTPRRACDLFRQIADALGEAHRIGLIHRDIKPGNIIVTPDWQAKVLDFGLARLPSGSITEPGTILGTIGYMAPEQARDPSGVDVRADLYSLGATMYWSLTGREPHPNSGNPIQDLQRRLSATVTPVRQVRPEVPVELSDLVERLMRADPDQRYPSAQTVAAALSGFNFWLSVHGTNDDKGLPAKQDRILLVDDEPEIRKLMMTLLAGSYDVREAHNADTALAEVLRDPPQLVVVDVHLPGASGPDLLGRIRTAVPNPEQVKVLLVSGEVPTEALGGLAASGADDFLAKPFTGAEFLSRIRSLLLRRSVSKGQTTVGGTVRIPTTVATRMPSPGPSQGRPQAAAETLSFTISQLLVDLGVSTPNQWNRIGRYIRALASVVRGEGEYLRLKDDTYLDLLTAYAPAYDVGLLGIPRSILMKPERFDADETSIIQTHTTQGAELLTKVAGRFGSEVPGLMMSVEIARSHHERWDGAGYPDMLAGNEIPLSARVVAIVMVYEAMRSRKPHRPALPHAHAVKTICESVGQFDPTILAAFTVAAPRFELIHRAE